MAELQSEARGQTHLKMLVSVLADVHVGVAVQSAEFDRHFAKIKRLQQLACRANACRRISAHEQLPVCRCAPLSAPLMFRSFGTADEGFRDDIN